MGDRLSDAFARLGREHRPKADWQRRVWERVGQPRPAIGWMVAAAGMLVLTCALALFLWQKSESEAKAKQEAAQKAMSLAEYENEMGKLKQNQVEQDALLEQYKRAATEEERKRIEEEIKQKRAEAAQIADRAHSAKKKGGGGFWEPRPKDKSIKVSCDPVDPLCGL